MVGTLCVSDCSSSFRPLLRKLSLNLLIPLKVVFPAICLSSESRSGIISKAMTASEYHCLIKKSCHFYTTKPQMVFCAIMCYGFDLYPFPTQCFVSSPSGIFVCVGGLWGFFFSSSSIRNVGRMPGQLTVLEMAPSNHRTVNNDFKKCQNKVFWKCVGIVRVKGGRNRGKATCSVLWDYFLCIPWHR